MIQGSSTCTVEDLVSRMANRSGFLMWTLRNPCAPACEPTPDGGSVEELAHAPRPL